MRKVAVVFGTRPEAIKLCPVVIALRNSPLFDCRVCVTGQHREMLRQVLDVFGVVPDEDLALMRPNQTLGGLTSRAISALDNYFAAEKPDIVMVQGDTTTVLAGALIATYHFAPTHLAAQHLKDEKIHGEILVTGNTVIDALHIVVERLQNDTALRKNLQKMLISAGYDDSRIDGNRRLILITGHRRENFGMGFEHICLAIRNLAERFPDVHFIYPVHLNPNVREPVGRILGHYSGRNVHLIEPQSYLPFVALMDRSYLVLTDSGGVQEEAPSLGKPVLVMRDTTERPEAVCSGTVKLVGTNSDAIEENVSRLLVDENVYTGMARAVNPYGDGKATERILKVLKEDEQ